MSLDEESRFNKISVAFERGRLGFLMLASLASEVVVVVAKVPIEHMDNGRKSPFCCASGCGDPKPSSQFPPRSLRRDERELEDAKGDPKSVAAVSMVAVDACGACVWAVGGIRKGWVLSRGDSMVGAGATSWV